MGGCEICVGYERVGKSNFSMCFVMPKITIIGDTHGYLDMMIAAIAPDTDFAIQVGDFGVYLKDSNLSSIPEQRRDHLGQFNEYFEDKKSFPVPIYFCKGNHEDFEFLQKYETQNEILKNLFYVKNGSVLDLQGVVVAFLGGNFSPRWFEKEIPALNPKHSQNHKVFGYFRKAEIDAILNYRGKIDVLITHEPSFGPNFGDRPYGCQAIQNLIEELQPTYAFSGHIHKFAEGRIGKTKCVALGAVHYPPQSVYHLVV